MTAEATLDEICVVNLADTFRADGEILCNPIGNVPLAAGRLARATFAPQLALTDGFSVLISGDLAVGDVAGPEMIEANMPFRSIFDCVWSGRRHVVMGGSQMDRHGNQNFAAIGPDYAQPKVQLLGMRGAPGNLINHVTSYWIPQHSTRVFVPKVDVVSGPGYDVMAAAGADAFHEIRRVVTSKAVLDFEATDSSGIHCMRLRSVHPGVTVDDVVENTGCELVVPEGVPTSRLPTDHELHVLRTVIDPNNRRKGDFPQ